MEKPWEWEEEDLQSLIDNQVQESLTLDYKRSAALDKRNPKSRDELSKDVAALANSAGGTLLYGVEETNHLPERLDQGIDPQELKREWIEHIINSTIHPRIDGVRVKQVLLKSRNTGYMAYVVHIPQSIRAPHMALDHTYPRRYNFESVAMEDYEVRDVMRRMQTPDLSVQMSLLFPNQPLPVDQHASVAEVDVALVNESDHPTEYAMTMIYVDSAIRPFKHDGVELVGKMRWEKGDISREVYAYSPIYSIRTQPLPLWRGVSFKLLDSPMKMSLGYYGKYLLGWEIQSPGMAPKEGRYWLVISGGKVSLTKEES